MRHKHLFAARHMSQGSLPLQMLLFSLPLMASNLLQVLFNMADIAVVGRYAGPLPLAAVGSTATAVTLFTGVLIGVSGGSIRVDSDSASWTEFSFDLPAGRPALPPPKKERTGGRLMKFRRRQQ